MANVFRSKEVYKHPPKSLHDKNEMIQVRGVYVSGEYRPPYYDENGVMINNIDGEKALVVNYTSRTISTQEDAVLRILDFDFDVTCPEVTFYSAISASSGYDAVLRILDFDFDVSTPDCLFYSQASASSGYDSVLRVLDLDFDVTCPSTLIYSKANEQNTPEPMLRLATIQTEKAVVTDYRP